MREVFVDSMQILHAVEHVFGKRFSEEVVKRSVFQQFAGGEDEQAVLRTLHHIAKRGVGTILFYSAEQDVGRWVFGGAAAHNKTIK